MPRNIPAATQAATEATVTSPRWLVYIGFPYTELRAVNSVVGVSWGGHSWQPASFEVTELSSTPDGFETMSVEFQNADNIMSALVLGQGIDNNPIQIYYRDGDDAVLRFDGRVISAPDIGMRVTLVAATEGADTMYSPRLPIAPHVFNHITPAGTKITFGGETYVLKRRDN